MQAIFKDLRDSGQQTTFTGHFSIQLGHIQDVTSIDNVHEQPRINLPGADAGKNPNRYTTEQERSSEGNLYPVSAVEELQPDLVEVIEIWQKLPIPIKTGILAMIRAIT